MYKLILIIGFLSIVYADDTYKNELPSLDPYDTTYQSYKIEQPTKQSQYYPTQTTPAPNVMYDYRVPTYDIYNYDKAPVK